MFKAKVLGHPAGLFVLFFTEMWERFSFYGMRVLLVNFLTMYIIGINPGWDWPTENAGAIYATYAGLLYLVPILGGLIADKYLGYQNSVAAGALIMAAGHMCMAMESTVTFYLGLTLLVIGTGFFKPNITSIISEMYKNLPEKKDGAYTIFYMGVNAGAFFGMMLCGYMAEKIGWSWGFGLAGIFMLLGLLQFWLARSIFGAIGLKPARSNNIPIPVSRKTPSVETLDDTLTAPKEPIKTETFKLNPFTLIDKIFTVICAVFGVVFLLDRPFSINGVPLIPEFIAWVDGKGEVIMPHNLVFIVIGLVVFFVPLIISRIWRYDRTLARRMVAFIIFAFFTVFFWMSFEQGATSLVWFARDYTTRVLEGGAATTFLAVDIFLTFGPLLIITWVLFRLWRETKNQILGSNLALAGCFLLIWGLGIWKTYRDLNTISYEIEYLANYQPVLDESGIQLKDDKGGLLWQAVPVTELAKDTLNATDSVSLTVKRMPELAELKPGETVLTCFENDNFKYVTPEKEIEIREQVKANEGTGSTMIETKIISIVDQNQVEVTVSWFSILNSFFIIALATFFSKLWESRFNPPAAIKYGLGLVIMGSGFGVLAFGSMGIGESSEIIRVSLFWLVLAYLLHTIGELCISPVGLSYVSKLVPGRMIAFMFGMWYLAIAIGNYTAAYLGGQIEAITAEYSMTIFFLIFTLVPVAAGVLVIALHPFLKWLMGGVK